MPDGLKAKTAAGAVISIALYLVYWGTSTLSSDLSNLKDEMKTHIVSVDNAAEVQSGQTTTIITLMRQMCLNTARTSEDRRECVR
jgi:hypothetical protein